MSRSTTVAAMLDVGAIMELIQGQLQVSHEFALPYVGSLTFCIELPWFLEGMIRFL